VIRRRTSRLVLGSLGGIMLDDDAKRREVKKGNKVTFQSTGGHRDFSQAPGAGRTSVPGPNKGGLRTPSWSSTLDSFRLPETCLWSDFARWDQSMGPKSVLCFVNFQKLCLKPEMAEFSAVVVVVLFEFFVVCQHARSVTR